ncbi:hypothetical protein E2C01_089030 [Portunus trituberculatus]|uniref:Uncharacterized protein n=1 Tax=Portunus trituberculatus TaxID=210409 RepID=A0A5B7JH14_PORTR|nr:hypothetical protein [Portunus trituberculatus]
MMNSQHERERKREKESDAGETQKKGEQGPRVLTKARISSSHLPLPGLFAGRDVSVKVSRCQGPKRSARIYGE